MIFIPLSAGACPLQHSIAEQGEAARGLASANPGSGVGNANPQYKDPPVPVLL